MCLLTNLALPKRITGEKRKEVRRDPILLDTQGYMTRRGGGVTSFNADFGTISRVKNGRK